jgi:hypothetical protein
VKSGFFRGEWKLNSSISYKNFILQFKMKDIRIWVYDPSKKLINIFDSIKRISESLNIPITTLRRYLKSGKLYKNKLYFYRDKL